MLIGAVMAAVLISGGGSSIPTADGASHSGGGESKLPFMSTAVGRAAVVASLSKDFCDGVAQDETGTNVLGFEYVLCNATTADHSGAVQVNFRVYENAAALQLAVQGGIQCTPGGSEVAGPTWYAWSMNPADIAPLVELGATPLNCGTN